MSVPIVSGHYPLRMVRGCDERSQRAANEDTPKAQTAKEVIATNVKLLIEQLEAGHSEGLTAYLTAMGRFHNYSFLCCD
ncbi:MAG TPA: hypothetical protein VK638_58935 [Edaphobacter sp.]|nr:hypothetical protein [Edaphobacter sp.]